MLGYINRMRTLKVLYLVQVLLKDDKKDLDRVQEGVGGYGRMREGAGGRGRVRECLHCGTPPRPRTKAEQLESPKYSTVSEK